MPALIAVRPPGISDEDWKAFKEKFSVYEGVIDDRVDLRSTDETRDPAEFILPVESRGSMLKKNLEAKLSELDPQVREILYRVTGLDQEPENAADVASSLGISLETLEEHLMAAKKQLKSTT